MSETVRYTYDDCSGWASPGGWIFKATIPGTPGYYAVNSTGALFRIRLGDYHQVSNAGQFSSRDFAMFKRQFRRAFPVRVEA